MPACRLPRHPAPYKAPAPPRGRSAVPNPHERNWMEISRWTKDMWFLWMHSKDPRQGRCSMMSQVLRCHDALGEDDRRLKSDPKDWDSVLDPSTGTCWDSSETLVRFHKECVTERSETLTGIVRGMVHDTCPHALLPSVWESRPSSKRGHSSKTCPVQFLDEVPSQSLLQCKQIFISSASNC